MREILFRGKRIGGKGWLYGYYSLNPTTNIHWIRTPRTIYWDEDMVEPTTVGQYTGLKDKNGKQIFDGDICSNIDGNFIVCWDDEKASFIMQFLEYPRERLLLEEMWDDTEIIGNIHDNPELIAEEHP